MLKIEQSFKNELNQYYIEDCIYTLENRIPDNSLDLVLTSPPYDKLRNYSNNYCFDFENIAKLLTAKLSKGGVIVWVVGDQTVNGTEMGTSFRQALFFKDICKLNIHDTMIFEKNTTSFPAKRTGKRYSQIFEYMFIFSKGSPKTANLICDKANRWAGYTNFGQKSDRDKNDKLINKKKLKPIPDFSPRNNIWKYQTGFGYSSSEKIAYKHPAIFPLQLAIDNIITWTNEGDIVYDPFLGSGTVAKASEKLKRLWCGSEINAQYEYIIKERIECKFQDVNGSTNKKLQHEIHQYQKNKSKSNESFFIIVYDGEFYDKKSKIINEVLSDIKYDYSLLFLNLMQFKMFLNDYLMSTYITETFKIYSEKTKKYNV